MYNYYTYIAYACICVLSLIAHIHLIGLLCRAINDMKHNKSHSLPTTSSKVAMQISSALLEWMPYHVVETDAFVSWLCESLQSCFLAAKKPPTNSKHRIVIWRKYHLLRTSDLYQNRWKSFLNESTGVRQLSSSFVQFIGHFIFKTLILANFSLDSPILVDRIPDLTHLELNAIRYTAGYVPRALMKKIKKSSASNTKDLLLCLQELLESDGENAASTADWLNAINRGGLFCINDVTFAFFIALEYEVRGHILAGQELGAVRSTIQQNEDVLFHWTLISATWDDELAAKLMNMIVDLWITIRGFSLASAWIEEYKGATKKTLQKSKPLRTQIS